MSVEIGIVLSIFGAVIGYVSFYRNKKQDDTSKGITLGTVMAKLDFMSGNILDIKSDIKDINNRQDKSDDRISKLETRVAIIESKIK